MNACQMPGVPAAAIVTRMIAGVSQHSTFSAADPIRLMVVDGHAWVRQGLDSPIVTYRMKELDPSSRVIALTNGIDPAMEGRALAAGAACCVLKESSAGALLEAIRAIRLFEAVGAVADIAAPGISTAAD